MPQKHHYIPVFYLKRWVGDDGQLCVFSRPQNEVRARSVYPRGTGYLPDLYAITGAGDETASHLEGRFFSETDNDAARALVMLETGRVAVMDAHQRSCWSRFLMTLLHRNPEAIAKSIGRAAILAAEAADALSRQNYATLRTLAYPETYEEYQQIAEKAPGYYAAKSTVLVLQRMMDSELIGRRLNRMAWVVVQLRSAYPLLTSDRPWVMTGSMVQPNFHLSVPILPRLLFIAANDLAVAQQLARTRPDDLATAMNDRIARQARKFVWGLVGSQLRFVERRFGAIFPMSILDRPEYSLNSR